MHVILDASALEKAMTRKDFSSKLFLCSCIESLLLGVEFMLYLPWGK